MFEYENICWLSILLKVQKFEIIFGALDACSFSTIRGARIHSQNVGSWGHPKGSQMVKSRGHFQLHQINILGFHVSPVNHDLESSFSNPPKIPASCILSVGCFNQKNIGGGFMFLKFSSPIWGRFLHFDDHIFQMGWFNHQLGKNGAAPRHPFEVILKALWKKVAS